MNRVHIRNQQKIIPVDRALLRTIVTTVIAKEKPAAGYEVSVCIVSDALMQDLNTRFHHCDSPTDVLAFSLGERPQEIIADIFVSAETAVTQAGIFHTNPRYELYLYCIHGVLHCAGYDDRTAAGRKCMRRMEKKYLNMFHIRQDHKD